MGTWPRCSYCGSTDGVRFVGLDRRRLLCAGCHRKRSSMDLGQDIVEREVAWDAAHQTNFLEENTMQDVRPITPETAQAFVASFGPKTVAHLEAILGYGIAPSVEDFSSHDPKAVDRCDALVLHLREIYTTLLEFQQGRERQDDWMEKDKKGGGDQEDDSTTDDEGELGGEGRKPKKRRASAI